MRITFSFIVLFVFSSLLQAQDSWEQNKYDHKIDLAVPKSDGYIHFLDSNNRFLGKKQVLDTVINYYDQRHRFLAKRTLLKATPVAKKDSAINVQVNIIETGPSRAVRTVRKRNKVYFYDVEGNLVRTARRSLFSNRVIYKDGQGRIVGSKKTNRKGVTTYKDRARRTTGKSYLNENGRMIYEAYKNRVTPQFMLSDPFLFDSQI